jgi:hypothetical protein
VRPTPLSGRARLSCCAPSVIESASSRMMTLCLPGGSVTFFWANALMRFRTTSIPRSSDALSSRTPSLNASPRSARASARMLVVLPVPGGPDRMRLGIFPCCASTSKRPTVSSLPTMSLMTLGRYFSSHCVSQQPTGQGTSAGGTCAGLARLTGCSNTSIAASGCCERPEWHGELVGVRSRRPEACGKERRPPHRAGKEAPNTEEIEDPGIRNTM